MVAQDRHEADPAQVSREQVRAAARLFRSVVEAEGRRLGGEDEGEPWVAVMQRLDYIAQLLLAQLNTSRAGVSAPSPRGTCALLTLFRCALLLWWAGAQETSLARSPRVPRVLLRLAALRLLWLAGVVQVVALHLLPPRSQRVLPARRLRVPLSRLRLLLVRPPLLRVLVPCSLLLRPLRVLVAARRRSSRRTRCPRARRRRTRAVVAVAQRVVRRVLLRVGKLAAWPRPSSGTLRPCRLRPLVCFFARF